jgi:hypothetical protein
MRAEAFGSDKIREILRPFGSRLQNVRASAEIFQEVLSIPLLDTFSQLKSQLSFRLLRSVIRSPTTWHN